ncbi:MAG: hypothetical protein OEV31_04445 [Gammaproteobacteria bacterium]|nr:hypothetical protein [Gammaproteobacteria bacterium]
MLKVLASLLCLLPLVSEASVLLGDAAKGKVIHEKQCTACHDSNVYTRTNRRVKTSEGLKSQVNGCLRQTGIKLKDAEIDDLVKYLNDTYYKLD